MNESWRVRANTEGIASEIGVLFNSCQRYRIGRIEYIQVQKMLLPAARSLTLQSRAASEPSRLWRVKLRWGECDTLLATQLYNLNILRDLGIHEITVAISFAFFSTDRFLRLAGQSMNFFR